MYIYTCSSKHVCLRIVESRPLRPSHPKAAHPRQTDSELGYEGGCGHLRRRKPVGGRLLRCSHDHLCSSCAVLLMFCFPVSHYNVLPRACLLTSILISRNVMVKKTVFYSFSKTTCLIRYCTLTCR